MVGFAKKTTYNNIHIPFISQSYLILYKNINITELMWYIPSKGYGNTNTVSKKKGFFVDRTLKDLDS